MKSLALILIEVLPPYYCHTIFSNTAIFAGVRRSPGSGGPVSIAEPERSGSLSDQCALVHNPPEK